MDSPQPWLLPSKGAEAVALACRLRLRLLSKEQGSAPLVGGVPVTVLGVACPSAARDCAHMCAARGTAAARLRFRS